MFADLRHQVRGADVEKIAGGKRDKKCDIEIK